MMELIPFLMIVWAAVFLAVSIWRRQFLWEVIWAVFLVVAVALFFWRLG